MIDDIRENTREEDEIFFEDKVRSKGVTTGWKFDLFYDSILSQDTSIRLTLDLTSPEKESVVTPVERHALIHPYSDKGRVDLITYSITEITLEKLRALCDRGWPRDLYDVYNLWPRIERSGFKELFFEKCGVKDVEPTLDRYIQRKEKIKSAWSKSLRHQLKYVPDFERCFQEVLEVLKSILLE